MSGRRVVNRGSRVLPPKRGTDLSRALGYRGINRGQRQSRTERNCVHESPFLEKLAPPAADQRSPADSLPGGVLQIDDRVMPLIETRAALFCAQIQPILSGRPAKRSSAQPGGIVQGFGISVGAGCGKAIVEVRGAIG